MLAGVRAALLQELRVAARKLAADFRSAKSLPHFAWAGAGFGLDHAMLCGHGPRSHPSSKNHKLITIMRHLLITAVTAALAAGSSFAQDAKVDFEKQLLPVLQERCFECHKKEYTDEKTGRIKKPKGKFRMDNPALMLKGGEEGKDVVPGKPNESSVYTSVKLPEDDDKAMPPKGDRLTAAQIELIKQWIAEGANFGTWKGAAE